MKDKVIGLIPARYGSIRFPGKPLVSIAGKTLLQRTYENAKRCKLLDDLVVATDDDRIFEHVTKFGGKAVMTSPDCLTGTDRLAEAVKNPKLSGFDIIVNVQGDEPFLDPHVIEAVVQKLTGDASAAMSTAVVKLTSKEDAFNHSVVKCVMDNSGNALYFSRTLIPSGKEEGKFRSDVTYYKHLDRKSVV